jgi:hypothetical protein
MIRRWRQGVLLAAVAAAAVVGGILLATRPWSDETLVQEAAGQPVEHRACNVVFPIPPESSEFEIIPIAAKPFNDGNPSLIVRMDTPRRFTDPNTSEVTIERPGAFIDAETGKVLSETYYTPSDETRLREVLATIRVEPFDPATAPWPYSDATTAPIKLDKVPPNGGVEIRSPDPGSGLVLMDGGDFLDVNSCKSTMRVDIQSGAIIRQDIHPDDAAAFQTFLDQVEVKGLALGD